jgi:hypothetical protein
MTGIEWEEFFGWPGLPGRALALALPFAAGEAGARSLLALVRWAERGAERPGPAVVDAAASALEQAAEWYEREEPGDAPRQMRLWLEGSR